MKLYFLTKKDKKLLREFSKRRASSTMVMSSQLIEECNCDGENVLSLERILEKIPSEASYCGEAETFLKSVFNDHFRDMGGPQLSVGGVSILETNAAALVLYYLRKGYKYKAMASKVLDAVQPSEIIIDSLDVGLAGALHNEAIKRNIRVRVVKRPPAVIKYLRNFLWRTMWYCREITITIKRWFKHGSQVSSADVLFVCNAVRQYESISPVVRELLKRSGIRSCVVSKPPIPVDMMIDDKRVTHVDWSLLRDARYLNTLFAKICKLNGVWRRMLGPIFKVKEGYLLRTVDTWFDVKADASIRALLIAEEVLKKVRPSVIVVTDPTDYEAKSFTMIGKKLGIPSFCIQYGMLCSHDSEWRYFDQDFVGAFDTESAHIIKGHGVAENRVLLTGSPRFDSYNGDLSLRKRIRKELCVPDTGQLIVFTSFLPSPEGIGGIESFWSLAEYEKILKMVYEVAYVSPDWVLAIKPHPDEDISLHLKCVGDLARNSERIRFISGYNSYQALNAADLVITAHSTTGLEAIYLNKPLVTVGLEGWPDYLDYASSGAAWPVKKKEELIPAIRALIDDVHVAKKYEGGRRLYTQRNPYFSNGHKSASRCAQIICSLRERRAV